MKSSVQSKDSITTYLQEIGRFPLLNHEQEIILGKQVQQMIALQDLKQQLTEQLDRKPTLSEWAEQAEMSVPQLQKDRTRPPSSQPHRKRGRILFRD